MKDWYQNRMETGIKHQGFSVPKAKYLYLTDLQAQTHNRENEQRVAKVDNPPEKQEVAVLSDWDEYEKSRSKVNPSPANTKTEATAVDKLKKSK